MQNTFPLLSMIIALNQNFKNEDVLTVNVDDLTLPTTHLFIYKLIAHKKALRGNRKALVVFIYLSGNREIYLNVSTADYLLLIAACPATGKMG